MLLSDSAVEAIQNEFDKVVNDKIAVRTNDNSRKSRYREMYEAQAAAYEDCIDILHKTLARVYSGGC